MWLNARLMSEQSPQYGSSKASIVSICPCTSSQISVVSLCGRKPSASAGMTCESCWSICLVRSLAQLLNNMENRVIGRYCCSSWASLHFAVAITKPVRNCRGHSISVVSKCLNISSSSHVNESGMCRKSHLEKPSGPLAAFGRNCWTAHRHISTSTSGSVS